MKKKLSEEAKPKTKKVRFNFYAPEAKRVFLAGDFNQWNPSSHPMKMDGERIWRISLALNPGQYEYRFFVDGEWQNDPNYGAFVENPFGTSNSLKIVR